MNNIIIVLSILVLFLVLNTKIDKFYFVMCFLAIYFLYLNMYNKENFIFNNRDNILKLHDKLNFFENNGITKSEYERQNNVTLKIDGDSYTEIPNEEPVEEEEIPEQPKMVVEYGDTIMLQCNAVENRYLTGNRDGYNSSEVTGDSQEGVYTTNEDKSLHEWIIMPMKDNLMNQPVKIMDKIYLIYNEQSSNDKKYLIGEQLFAALPYNTNEKKCGVFTRNKDSMNDNYSYHKWQILKNKKLLDNKSELLHYDDLIYLKLNTKFLSGARLFGFIENEHNQQVYTVGENDGDNDLLWIIRKEKKQRPKLNVIKVWEEQPDLIENSNNFINVGDYNSIFGDEHYSEKINNEIKFRCNDNCDKKKFILINFNEEKEVRNGFLKHKDFDTFKKITFFVKVADKDGIFCDLPNVFSSDFLFSWLKEDNQIHIKKGSDNLYFDNNENTVSFKQTTTTTPKPTSFTIKMYEDYFYLINKNDKGTEFIFTIINGEFVPEKYNPTVLPEEALLIVKEKEIDTNNYTLQNIHNDELDLDLGTRTDSTLEISSVESINDESQWINFDINKKIQYVKIYIIQPELSSNTDYNIVFKDLEDNTIPFKENNPTLKIDTIEQTNQPISPDENNNNGENTEIDTDLNEEKLVRGVIIEEDSNSEDYVNKLLRFKLKIAGNNKIYTDLGEYTINLTDKDKKIEIFKRCRYIKLIILKCSSNECKFNLKVY